MRNAMRVLIVLSAAVLLFSPVIAQDSGRDEAVMEGCKHCDRMAETLADLRCESCKEASVGCAKCQARGQTMSIDLLCPSCQGDSEKPCDKKACLDKKSCAQCVAQTTIAAGLYCSEKCQKAKTTCEACKSMRALLGGEVCKTCEVSKEEITDGTEILIERGQLKIKIERSKSEVKGWEKFKVIVESKEAEQKTVIGKIRIYGKEDPTTGESAEIGRGTFYIEAKPSDTVTRDAIRIRRKDGEAVRKISGSVTKVFNF